jgi:hypothetical protein
LLLLFFTTFFLNRSIVFNATLTAAFLGITTVAIVLMTSATSLNESYFPVQNYGELSVGGADLTPALRIMVVYNWF